MKNLLIIFSILIVLLCGACTKLTEDPRGKLTPEQFFQNPTEIQQFIYGAYVPLNNYEFYAMGWWNMAEAINDQVTARADLRVGFAYNTPGDGHPTLWKLIYSGINSANMLITRVNANQTLSETAKIPYIAEARFLRGLYYFHAVVAYGAVPLVLDDTPVAVAAAMSRSDTSLVWDQIISDMTYAAENCPDNFGNVKSRGTKWSALALLSRMYMYDKQFEKAAEAAKAVIESKKYSLMPNFADVFLEENDRGPEVVFSVEFMPSVYTSSHASFFTTRSDYEPSTTPGKTWNGWNSNAVGSLLPGMFEPNDLRKEQTVINKNVLDHDKPFLRSTWNFGPKFWDFNNPRALSAKDFKVMRYAEVLLNYAEAANEAYGPSEAAYNALNQVRTRAGLAPVGGLTQDQFRETVRHERGVELVGEGHRKWDLIRWGIWLPTMKSLPDIDLPAAGKANITSRYKLLPIPDVEIAKNPNLLPNNPGY